jgi:hypothetical protein
MAHRKNLQDGIETEFSYDTDSYEYVEHTELDMDEEHYEEEEQPSPPVQQKPITKWGLQSQADQTCVPQSTYGDRGKKQSEALHISKDLLPLSFFSLCFTSLSDLLVTETNRYYHQCLEKCDRTQNPLPDITKCFCFSNYYPNGPRHMWQTQGRQGQNNSSRLSTRIP